MIIITAETRVVNIRSKSDTEAIETENEENRRRKRNRERRERNETERRRDRELKTTDSLWFLSKTLQISPSFCHTSAISEPDSHAPP